MRHILFLKHWQLLAIIFLPAILVDVFSTDIVDIWHEISATWGAVVYFIWLYLVGISFSEKFDKGLLLFKASFFYIVSSTLIFSFGHQSENSENTIWLISCALLGLLASFYIIYFVALCLVSFSKNKGDHDFSFLKFFLCFLFFPVGICLLQPRINRYIGDWTKENSFDS